MQKDQNQIAKISIFITSIFIIFLSITYAFINQTVYGTKRQVITSSTLSIELEEEKELTIQNALPMYDEVGKIQKDSFQFKLINNSNYKVDYTLHLSDITKEDREKLNYEDVKYYLTKDEQDLKLELLLERTEDIIDQGVIASNQTINYTLRFWIDSKVENNDDIHNKTLSFQLIAKATEHIPEKYTIMYHTGTDEVIENQIKTEDEDITLPAITSTKENRIFLGWSTEENGDTLYKANTTFSENGNQTLYAVWGIHYLYNRGNQFVSDTGGWKYTKIYTSGSATHKEDDHANFGTQYIEWYKTKTGENGYNHYGSGVFENINPVDLRHAKQVVLEYTIPTVASGTYLGVTYYPLLQSGVVDTNAQKSVGGDYLYPSSAIPNLTKMTMDINGDLTSLRVRVSCYATNTSDNKMVFRLYSVEVIY